MKLSIFSVATLFACGCTAGQIAAVNSATSAVFTVEQEACVLANQSLLGTTTAVKDLEIACPAIAAAERKGARPPMTSAQAPKGR